MDLDRDGEADIAELVEDSTYMQGPRNPFVSTTSNLNTAIRYAEAARSTGRPYISGYTPASGFRTVPFKRYLGFGELAAANQEWGVVGIVFDEEVAFRIYTEDLTPSVRSHILDVASGQAKVYLGPRIPDADLVNMYSPDFMCPSCDQSLPFYFRRTLTSSDTVRVLDARNYSAPLLYRTQSRAEGMAEVGLACRCPSCQQWLHNPTNYEDDVVTITVLSAMPCTISVENRATSRITKLILGFHFSGASSVAGFKSVPFGPAYVVRPDTLWPDLRSTALRAGYDEQFAKELMAKMIDGCEPLIEPSERRELRLDVRWPDGALQLERVTVARAHFESGRIWGPQESFHVTWETMV